MVSASVGNVGRSWSDFDILSYFHTPRPTQYLRFGPRTQSDLKCNIGPV